MYVFNLSTNWPLQKCIQLWKVVNRAEKKKEAKLSTDLHTYTFLSLKKQKRRVFRTFISAVNQNRLKDAVVIENNDVIAVSDSDEETDNVMMTSTIDVPVSNDFELV